MTNNDYPIRPVGYRILVKLEEVSEYSDGGIIMYTGKEKERQQLGKDKATVVAIGDTAYKSKDGDPRFDGGAWCKIGDVVAIPSYAGFRVEKGSEVYQLINDEDVVGVYNE